MADCFVGRQPIIDRDNNVVAYDLLYRSGMEDSAGDINRTVATSRLIVAAFVDIGLDKIVGSHRAVLNVTESFLNEPELACFPPERVILGLPGSTPTTAATLAAVVGLKERGYEIAVNDYGYEQPVAGLIEYADMVKFDALSAGNETLRRELAVVEQRRIMRVAKRVETEGRRSELAALGFDAFQGRFLARPEIVTGTQLPTNRMAVLELVTRLNDPDIESKELASLVAMDPTLSLRILRFVNSPLSGLSNTVDSIHQAIVMAGGTRIKTWAMLLAIASFDNTVPELMTAAFVRARFCELAAREGRALGPETYFTVGLFSLMDSMLRIPMHELVGGLPFTPEIKGALTAREGAHGTAVEIVERFEQGEVSPMSFGPVDAGRLAALYLDAIAWADRTVGAVV